jgi:tetratricopeptide (TPR) repeat protein
MKKSLLTSIAILILFVITAICAQATDQLVDLRNSGRSYYRQGDLPNAIKMTEKAVDHAKKEYGDNHGMTMDAKLELAFLYLEHKAIKKSESVCLGILKLRNEPDDMHIGAKNMLAKVELAKNEFKKAEEILVSIVKLQQEKLNQYQSKITQSRSEDQLSKYKDDLNQSKQELGRFYASRGDNNKAEKLFLEPVNTGKDSDSCISRFFDLQALGDFYLKSDQLDKGAKIYEQMLTHSTRCRGAQHVTNHSLMMELSGVYYSLEQFAKAERKLLDALEFTEKYSDGPFEKAGSRKFATEKTLGNFYYNQKRYQEAQSHYERAFTQARKVFDKAHPEYHRTMISLASSYQELKNYDKAELYLKDSLQLSEEIDNKNFTLASKKKLAGLYTTQGLKQKAIKQLIEAVELSEITLGKDHDYTLELKIELLALTDK